MDGLKFKFPFPLARGHRKQQSGLGGTESYGHRSRGPALTLDHALVTPTHQVTTPLFKFSTGWPFSPPTPPRPRLRPAPIRGPAHVTAHSPLTTPHPLSYWQILTLSPPLPRLRPRPPSAGRKWRSRERGDRSRGSLPGCSPPARPRCHPPPMGVTGWALSHAMLAAVCLLCAQRARQVTEGPAAGFLLQALAAASDALAPLWSVVVTREDDNDPDPFPGAWISAMLAQPLVAFGFHRLSGDRATANLLLGGATALALITAVTTSTGTTRAPAEGHLMAAHAVTFLTTCSLLTLAGLTGNGTAALGGLLVAAGNQLSAPGTQQEWHPWVLAAGNLALERALRVQKLGVE
ncbi:transmembrane protein 276 [Indicator indicator]|uniref:transmembrane protein 276 n=1 Tax=Indicator indicator TaxID=1002788 RepID=UPI0023E02B1E|nr:transmembrane protein 276 [Indicator indicator]